MGRSQNRRGASNRKTGGFYRGGRQSRLELRANRLGERHGIHHHKRNAEGGRQDHHQRQHQPGTRIAGNGVKDN